MTTATAEATKNDAACVLISLIGTHPREYRAIEQTDGETSTFSLLDEGVVHQVISDRPARHPDDGTVWGEARYRALKITPTTSVTVRTTRDDDGERHDWIFGFSEGELRLSGAWDSDEVTFAKELHIQLTKVAVLA
jgi:hypothetical protein